MNNSGHPTWVCIPTGRQVPLAAGREARVSASGNCPPIAGDVGAEGQVPLAAGREAHGEVRGLDGRRPLTLIKVQGDCIKSL